ncbi:Rv3654c family TadE-like protein [Streptomyces sp. NPDC005803]|uniref:Rv3654c family TadE-like protein n=1 Tax=Streptomyces sp. NPDC005803 TaxID=3154297 RepID=UPI0033FAC037
MRPSPRSQVLGLDREGGGVVMRPSPRTRIRRELHRGGDGAAIRPGLGRLLLGLHALRRLRVCGRWRDQGLATVWAAVTTATLCVVFAVILTLGEVVVVRHRAGGAADLAALAAADRALEGSAIACRSAREVAAAQGAEVVRCVVQGEIADVTARVRHGPYGPEVRSRAGPPTAAPTGSLGSAGSPVPPETVVGPPGTPAPPEGRLGRDKQAALPRRGTGRSDWITAKSSVPPRDLARRRSSHPGPATRTGGVR